MPLIIAFILIAILAIFLVVVAYKQLKTTVTLKFYKNKTVELEARLELVEEICGKKK